MKNTMRVNLCIEKCNWLWKNNCVVDFNEQETDINQIMLHYSGKEWGFNEKMLKSIKLWKIEIDEFSGKKSGY